MPTLRAAVVHLPVQRPCSSRCPSVPSNSMSTCSSPLPTWMPCPTTQGYVCSYTLGFTLWKLKPQISFAGAHKFEAPVLVFLFDIHGHRGQCHSSPPSQRHLRLDRGPLPVLPGGADWLEKQRPSQPVPEQVLQEGRQKSCKCFADVTKQSDFWICLFTECWQGLVMDGGPLLQTQLAAGPQKSPLPPVLAAGAVCRSQQ